MNNDPAHPGQGKKCMPPIKKPHFNHVLICTDVEVHAKRDRVSVKALGPEIVKHCLSGSEAVDYLSQNPVDLVICDSTLADMDGTKFLGLVRKNMKLHKLPVVMVTLENSKGYVLDVVSAGCSGYVLRPYAQDTLERHVLLAKQVSRYKEIEEVQLEEAREMVCAGDFDDAVEAFQDLLAQQEDARKYYDQGCRHLLIMKFGKAIICFKQALRINDLYAEAYKGLADAYKGKGDEESCKISLKKAAEIYASFDRLEETKKIFIEILKYETKTPNPYNTLGVRLRQQGDLAGAIHAYGQALELTPEDENIHFNLAKAYYFMGELEKATASITLALSFNPHFNEAQTIHKRLTGGLFIPSEEQLKRAARLKQDHPQSAVDV